ncbi:hypothetical protein MNBD_NITROSPINAE04-2720 [hydrothermal vent metagenome]|uniref:Uncharacterized protein n=1 Tax=hydrothermal vent metagenome TaxID=652676 RepID=A0A3B1CMB1_9ZZZZ
MKFASASGRWLIEDYNGGPEGLMRSLTQKVVDELPQDALGHVKGFAEFDGGEVYVSSTLIPVEINLSTKGKFKGGAITANMVLVFAELTADIMEQALELGKQKVETGFNCRFIKERKR